MSTEARLDRRGVGAGCSGNRVRADRRKTERFNYQETDRYSQWGEARRFSNAILAFKEGDRSFFVYGFAKKDKENINSRELIALKALARELMNYTNSDLTRAAASGELEEIERNG